MAASLRSDRLHGVSRGGGASEFYWLFVAALLAVALLGSSAEAQTTTISGHVYVPNAVDPLPNALVYVTTGTVAAFASGTNCPGAQCLTASNAVPANAIVNSYTAVDGSFTLTEVPENTTYTLVIQAGKWRRQFSQVVETTPITGLALDMPATHADGDIPLIAIATGSADTLECALRDVGVADGEFTDDNGGTGGRIHLYKGEHAAGAEINSSTPNESTLVGTPATLNNYDMVMFPCQGDSATEAAGNIRNLLAYTSAGGRIFATHWSLVLLNTNTSVLSGPYSGATFAGVANWDVGQSNPTDGAATINAGFTDGSTLAQWIQDLGKSSGNLLGQISISTLRQDTDSVIAPTQTWLTLNSNSAVMQFTFNTPVGAAAAGQYGRVLFNEYHVENATDAGGKIFPAECGSSPYDPLAPSAMSAQEKMLEYALFDLSNFVTPIVRPTVSIGITTSPSDSIFTEGDSSDTITVDVTDTSGTLPLDTNTVLAVTLPPGLTATAMVDTAMGWNCNVGTLTCTRTTDLAASASDSVLITVSVAGNATGGALSTTPSVLAVVSNPTFSSSFPWPLMITLDQHATVTWSTPADVADGTALSGTELNAVGNTAGTYVYTPPATTVLAAGAHTLSVNFTPSDQETYPGTATTTVTLTVNSPTAAAATAPAATNFGSVPVSTASNRQSATFTFTAPGIIGAPVVVTEGATGQDFTDDTTGTCDTNGNTYVYSSSNTCTVNVIFTPKYPGSRFGAVRLEDGSGNMLATAYLYGVGTGPELNFLPGLETQTVTSSNGIAKPQGLALDGSGNLYIADYTNHAIYRTTPMAVTTKILDLSGGADTPEALAVDGAGNLYIGDSHNNQILQATPSGSTYVLNPSPVASGLNSSGGVAVDQYGNVYVADTNNNRILLETRQSNGTYVQGIIVPAATSLLGATLNTPFDVAVDANGNFYIADTRNNRVVKETFNGESYTPSLVGSGLDWPTQLVVDGEGNLYFANNGHSSAANARIYKETPAGESYTQSAVPTSLTASNLWGVAVAANGNVYFSDTTDTKVIEENFASAPSLSFASTNVGATSSDSPQAVTLENIGNAALVLTSSGLTAPADFAQVAGSGSPLDCADSGSVAAGAACDLSIKFAPTTAGNPLSESFGVHDNSLNAAPAVQNIALSGIGISPISVLPSNSTLFYGTVGTAYAGVTFTASGGTGPYSFTHTGSLPGGLTLSGSGVLTGTPTTASGPYSFTVIATDVHSVSGSRSYALTINLGAATVTLGDLAQTYSGSPRAVTVTTNPPELTVNVVYTGTGGTSYGPSSTPPTAVGRYTVVGTVSDENYTGANTGTLVISEPNATVALGNLAQTYTGSLLSATATTTPANLAVHFLYTGTAGTSYGPSSTPPTGAGSYTVVGTISSETYSGTATGTLAIAKAAATVTLGSLLQTYTGSALAATASTNPNALPVNLTYAGSPSTPIAAGSYAVVGAVSDPNYVGTSSGTLIITPATSTAIVVSNSNPAAEQSAVKFTATVSSSAGTPSGTVKFLDGTSLFLECRLARDHGGLHRSHELRLVYQRGCETGGAELQLDSWIGGRKREQRRWR